MANKYRFKEQFSDAQIAIPGVRKLFTAHNITDKDAEMIIKKFPRFAHNLEEVDQDSPGAQAPDAGSDTDQKKTRKRRKRNE